MLKNQRGNIVFWVLSVVLAIALIFVLAISGKFNLDPQKNVDNCTTYMKNIWVAARDYVTDRKADYDGNLNTLRTTKRPDGKSVYLMEEKFCPESQGAKDGYIVFGKHMTELVDGEKRDYTAVLVLCPNLAEFYRHTLSKSFFDNQSTSRLQRTMVADLETINKATASDSKKKADLMLKYMNFWKNTKLTDYNEAMADMTYRTMMSEITGEPLTEETEETPES